MARTALTNSFFLVIVRVLVVAPASIGDSFLLDLLFFIDLLGDSAILAGSFWGFSEKKKTIRPAMKAGALFVHVF